MLFLLAVAFAGIVLLAAFPAYRMAVMIIWLAAVLISLAALIRFHAAHTRYRCPGCGHLFMISALTDAIHPHLPGVKYLKCPSCGARGWCQAHDVNTDTSRR